MRDFIMRNFVTNLFKKSTKDTSAFSDFFTEYSQEEKEKILEEAVKKANEDQRKIIEGHDKELAQKGGKS